MRNIALEKDGELFAYRFEKGQEEFVLEDLIRAAEDSDNPIDWYDAAVLSVQLKPPSLIAIRRLP